MRHWDKIIEQKVSENHEQQVLSSVDSLLEKNVARAAQRKSRAPGWLIWLMPVAATVAVVAFVFSPAGPFQQSNRNSPTTTLAAASPVMELAIDFDMLSDLREIQSLEILEKLEDPKKWKAPKSRTRQL